MKWIQVVGAAAFLLSSCANPFFAQEGNPAKAHPVKHRQAPDDLAPGEALAARIYREVLPTVVTIYASRRSMTPAGPRKENALGSGVLIAPECLILTAAHVVVGADEIRVKTQDGQQRPAELIYSETGADIALLQLRNPDPDLPHAPLGDSDRLAVGQWAFVIGSPQGLENSFSAGHISGFREFGHLYDGSILVQFIQTDAAINSGNSGGPVFNSKGEVIGIASRILTRSGGSEGLGFAVAINTAKALLALEDRAWTGMQGVFLDQKALAALFHLDLGGGLLIQRVTRGSPADRAGLRGGTISALIIGREILLGGDLVVAIGEQEACHSHCLARAREHLGGQDLIPVTFLRGGERRTASIDVSSTRRNLFEKPDRPGQ